MFPCIREGLSLIRPCLVSHVKFFFCKQSPYENQSIIIGTAGNHTSHWDTVSPSNLLGAKHYLSERPFPSSATSSGRSTGDVPCRVFLTQDGSLYGCLLVSVNTAREITKHLTFYRVYMPKTDSRLAYLDPTGSKKRDNTRLFI